MPDTVDVQKEMVEIVITDRDLVFQCSEIEADSPLTGGQLVKFGTGKAVHRVDSRSLDRTLGNGGWIRSVLSTNGQVERWGRSRRVNPRDLGKVRRLTLRNTPATLLSRAEGLPPCIREACVFQMQEGKGHLALRKWDRAHLIQAYQDSSDLSTWYVAVLSGSLQAPPKYGLLSPDHTPVGLRVGDLVWNQERGGLDPDPFIVTELIATGARPMAVTDKLDPVTMERGLHQMGWGHRSDTKNLERIRLRHLRPEAARFVVDNLHTTQSKYAGGLKFRLRSIDDLGPGSSLARHEFSSPPSQVRVEEVSTNVTSTDSVADRLLQMGMLSLRKACLKYDLSPSQTSSMTKGELCAYLGEQGHIPSRAIGYKKQSAGRAKLEAEANKLGWPAGVKGLDDAQLRSLVAKGLEFSTRDSLVGQVLRIELEAAAKLVVATKKELEEVQKATTVATQDLMVAKRDGEAYKAQLAVTREQDEGLRRRLQTAQGGQQAAERQFREARTMHEVKLSEMRNNAIAKTPEIEEALQIGMAAIERRKQLSSSKRNEESDRFAMVQAIEELGTGEQGD